MNIWSKKPLPMWRKRLSIVLWIVFLGFVAFIVFNSKFPILLKYGFTSKGYHEMLRTSNDPDIRLGNFSPDGSKVILNYRPKIHNENHISYMGILDIFTGHLDLIRPSSQYKLWYDGSFSPDGKEIIFSYTLNENTPENTGIGILELATWSYRDILKSNHGKQYLAFSPDAKRLIYFQREYVRAKDGKMLDQGTDVYEMELETFKEHRLTSFGFFAGGNIRYFPDGNTYIMSADYPTHLGANDTKRIQPEYSKYYKDNTIYIFNRNNQPSQAIPAIIYKDHSNFEDISSDGTKILCTALSDLHKRNQQGKYNYELFMYEDKQMNQLTDLQWMIIDAALSPDAKKAVFVADTLPSRGNERQIWLLDIETNTASHIEIKPENSTSIDVK